MTERGFMKYALLQTRGAIVVALVFILAVIASAIGLKAEHAPRAAINVAQEFLDRLQAKEFAQAHELTVKNNGYVGATPAELERITQRQLCKVTRVAGTSPFQSHGNRLRRRLAGAQVEMPEVRVEFAEGACLLGVTVRYIGAEQWKVYYFARHAG